MVRPARLRPGRMRASIHSSHSKFSRLKTISKITGKGSKPLLDLFMGSSKGFGAARPSLKMAGRAGKPSGMPAA